MSQGPMRSRVIIGDAAHAPSPTSGQGASMAAEDGVILAKALRDLPSIPEALVAYDRLRRARVEKIVAWGAQGSSAKVPGTVGRVIRDLFLRFAFRFFVTERSMAWQFDHRVEWDRPLTGEAQEPGLKTISAMMTAKLMSSSRETRNIWPIS